MLKDMMARIGIGAATVDTLPDNVEVTQGGRVSGTIRIRGGEVEQRVDRVELKLMTEAKQEVDDGTVRGPHALALFAIDEQFTLVPGETHDIPFAIELHPETPVTAIAEGRNESKVWLDTSLDIDFALDPRDKDYLLVHPAPVVAAFMRGMQKAGYRAVKADVEKGFLSGDGFRSTSGIYQELEYAPGGFGLGWNRIKEVELSFICRPDAVHVIVELDRSFSGDGYRCLTLHPNTGEAEVRELLAGLLQ
ncbi:sporulation protein [Marinobacterium weihaiense]|uniref:Sporulation protein n=1 Tax=Marinobacterium weihaiense TaxID=2851016 RepID=A0ABS6M9A1_9GAMM|nr:sporulation protein [Marinobacterium weihaiense]MBV0932471.1 sporulation protein [Marinobacterium weihaiense]